MDAAREELKYSEEAIELTLGRSRFAAAGLAVMALATLAVVAATPGSPALRILLATCVLCAALEAAHGLGLGGTARRGLLVRGPGEIDVRAPDGAWRSGVVRAGSFVAPWLTIVVWRPHGSRLDRAVLVLPDMLEEEDFRRLRVWLRWA
jgi:toxin CptA